MLLEQLIQPWDWDPQECQSQQCPDEYQSNARHQIPPQQSQPPNNYNNRFESSASCDRQCPTQYQSTGLWCDAHKCQTHNTKDCVWLKGQNAQQNNHQDPG
uniref:Uncharacterized protein n=1 Tax=Romanomermis culicivorax TaxID=13658 RepID=A0A915KRW9_ROMCU